MRNKHSPWDEPGVMEALVDIASIQKYSAAEIAVMLSKRFNLDISRNSVIGRMARNNIALRGKKNRPTSAPYAKRPSGVPAQPKPAKPIKVDPLEPLPMGDVSCGCRFLHGDALDRNFCGAPTSSVTSSWCDYHARIVFNTGAGAPCVKLGRKFIGIEIEPEYFNKACNRIDEAYCQPRLFKDEPPKPKQEALL